MIWNSITSCHPALQVVFYLTDLRGEIWVLFADFPKDSTAPVKTSYFTKMTDTVSPASRFTIDSPSHHLTLTRPLEIVGSVGIKSVWGVKVLSARTFSSTTLWEPRCVSLLALSLPLHGAVQFVNIKAWPPIPTSDLLPQGQRGGNVPPTLSFFQTPLFFLSPCSFLRFSAHCHQLISAAFSKLLSPHVLKQL